MATTFSINNNKSIFIYGDCSTGHDELIKSFLYIYSGSQGVEHRVPLLLIDPKIVIFNEYKEYAFGGKLLSSIDNILDDFEKFKKIEGNKIVFISEIIDYLRDEHIKNKFIKFIKEILDGTYPSIKVIFQLQPEVLELLDNSIYEHNNLIMFNLNK